jgi:hypothetical protein
MSEENLTKVNPSEMPDNLHCIVCYEKGADRHVFNHEKEGVWYAGLSYHHKCLDLSEVMNERRKDNIRALLSEQTT